MCRHGALIGADFEPRESSKRSKDYELWIGTGLRARTMKKKRIPVFASLNQTGIKQVWFQRSK
jgi:hypothetical protein